VLAQALSGAPIYCAFERPQGKVLVLTVNLDQGDLPLRTAFPILATNALGWFSGNRGELREALAAGAVTEVDLSAKAAELPGELTLRAPDGSARTLPAKGGKLTVGPLDQCGVWAIAASAAPDAAPVHELACNLASRPESDLRPPERLTAKEDDAPLAAGFAGRPVWFYLLATAWALTALEWCMYQRRTIS
jgi:hypothetical protein